MGNCGEFPTFTLSYYNNLKIADHACVIQQGRIVRYGTGAEILQEENFLSSYLGNSKQVKQED